MIKKSVGFNRNSFHSIDAKSIVTCFFGSTWSDDKNVKMTQPDQLVFYIKQTVTATDYSVQNVHNLTLFLSFHAYSNIFNYFLQQAISMSWKEACLSYFQYYFFEILKR